MCDYKQILNSIKCDVLTQLISTSEQSLYFRDYFVLIKKCLEKYFGITNTSFLSYEANTLFPLNAKAKNIYEMRIEALSWTVFQPFFYQQKLSMVPLFLKEHPDYVEMTDMILCQVDSKQPIGILLLQKTTEWEDFSKSNYFNELVNLLTNTIYMVNDSYQLRESEKQYRKLYNMTELFHSTMDIDVILENVLVTIQDNFEELEVELILSNDHDRQASQTKLNIKLFDYISERPSTIEAFVSGEITIEQAEDLNRRVLNAPIKGRQAIYGILQVKAPIRYVFTNVQKDFIRKLANASGNALENAKLYHQSHRLISDLQLINETSHRLNTKISIDEMLIFLQKQLFKSFQPMEIGFVFENNGRFEVAAASTHIFKEAEGKTYIQHAEKHFKSSTDSLFIADFSRLINVDIDYQSLMAIPMIVEERIIGFCIVLHTESYFFSFDSFKLMQSLIHHSSLAIANSKLRSQLQEMVDRDHLTKLFARSYLDRYVENSLHHDQSGMFLLIDIDNFKSVNDTYGHQVGDQILVQIAEQLVDKIGTSGICARWGGEELSVYVPNIHEAEALDIANLLVRTIPQVTSPRVTISAGLVVWENTDKPAFQSIFLQADTALYKAKNQGKNQFCLFDDSLQYIQK